MLCVFSAAAIDFKFIGEMNLKVEANTEILRKFQVATAYLYPKLNTFSVNIIKLILPNYAVHN
jgi:hypothetical protein